MKSFWSRRGFNVLGAALALGSIAVPWYAAWYCGKLTAVWLFPLGLVSWLTLFMVLGGGVLSLFSRYGGISTLVASVVFALTFQTGQLFHAILATPAFAGCANPGAHGLVVPGIISPGPNVPAAYGTAGLWLAVAGGIISLMGKSRNLNLARFRRRQDRTIIAGNSGWRPKSQHA